jgi:cell division protein FtsL
MIKAVRRALRAAVRRWWLVAFVIATLWVWQRYAVVQAGHRIAERRARIEGLIETRDALLAENTTLSSRARIESIATTRLGLRPTLDAQYARLNRAGVSDASLPNGNTWRSHGPELETTKAEKSQ